MELISWKITYISLNYYISWKMLETETGIRYGPCFQKVHDITKNTLIKLF